MKINAFAFLRARLPLTLHGLALDFLNNLSWLHWVFAQSQRAPLLGLRGLGLPVLNVGLVLLAFCCCHQRGEAQQEINHLRHMRII